MLKKRKEILIESKMEDRKIKKFNWESFYFNFSVVTSCWMFSGQIVCWFLRGGEFFFDLYCLNNQLTKLEKEETWELDDDFWWVF